MQQSPTQPLLLPYQEMVDNALKRLASVGSDPNRANASTQLCKLGAIFNGTTHTGVTFVMPDPPIQALIPDWEQQQAHYHPPR